MPEPRFIDETLLQMAELMTPDLSNFAGKVHGGAILSLLDKAAYACACRHAGSYCVTVAVDAVEFREPVCVGELLHLTSRVVGVGRSSMEIETLVESQNLHAGTTRHTNTCWFTMVAMRDGKPAPVAPVRARTPEDELRMAEARMRKELRGELKRRRAELLEGEA